MKIGLIRLFFSGVALAAGVETGRLLAITGMKLAEPEIRKKFKEEYRSRMDYHGANIYDWDKWSKTLRPDDETPTSGA